MQIHEFSGSSDKNNPAAERVYDKPTCKLKIDLPKTKTLFDECVWGPFVSNEEPGPGSWDAEDRATIAAVAKGKLKKHVCGDKGGALLSISAYMKLQAVGPRSAALSLRGARSCLLGSLRSQPTDRSLRSLIIQLVTPKPSGTL